MNEEMPKLAEDYRWILPPEETPSLWWVWVAIGAALLLLLLAAFLVKRRKIKLPFLQPPLPHAIALKALQHLPGTMREDADLDFAKSVSGIIREYIQGRFELRAPHRSTEEFLREAQLSASLSPRDRDLLGVFLGECDKVKFARRRFSLEQMQRLHSSAVEFVRGTIPATGNPKTEARS